MRLGGLAIVDPTKTADAEYDTSIRVTAPLVALIVAHEKSLGKSHVQQRSIRKEIHAEKRKKWEETANMLMEQLPQDMRRNVQPAQEKVRPASFLFVHLRNTALFYANRLSSLQSAFGTVERSLAYLPIDVHVAKASPPTMR